MVTHGEASTCALRSEVVILDKGKGGGGGRSQEGKGNNNREQQRVIGHSPLF